MIAVDTNVLVRLLTGDDQRQASAARSLFAEQEIWIAKTVLLETNWVLKSLYGFDEETTCAAFANLLGLANVRCEDAAGILSAFALVDAGLDFAAALHLSSRPPEAEFVSFDRALVRRALRAGAPRVSQIGQRG